MLVNRFFVLVGAIALMGGASPAAAQDGGKQALDSAAFVSQFPEALLYEGVALVKAGDTLGAIRAWERLQELAPKGTDSAVVRELIEGVFFQAYPLARLHQGVAYYLSSDFDRAIGSWQKYLAVCRVGIDVVMTSAATAIAASP